MNYNGIKKLLLGTWQGTGYSQYPTIRPASYIEEFEVTAFEDTEVLRFEQKAWFAGESHHKEKPVFWEAGFWVFKDDGLRILSSQFSGRFELLNLVDVEELGSETRLNFESQEVVNDPRVLRSTRRYTLSANTLSYELDMEMANHQKLENHCSAKLLRVT